MHISCPLDVGCVSILGMSRRFLIQALQQVLDARLQRQSIPLYSTHIHVSSLAFGMKKPDDVLSHWSIVSLWPTHFLSQVRCADEETCLAILSLQCWQLVRVQEIRDLQVYSLCEFHQNCFSYWKKCIQLDGFMSVHLVFVNFVVARLWKLCTA